MMQQQIIDMIRERGSIIAKDLIEANPAVSPSSCRCELTKLFRAGVLCRSSEHCGGTGDMMRYRYTLARDCVV